MKQLSQDLFNRPECPDFTLSAAIDPDGTAWGWSAHAEKLGKDEFGYTARLPANRVVYFGRGFDATNWQNSAINKKV